MGGDACCLHLMCSVNLLTMCGKSQKSSDCNLFFWFCGTLMPKKLYWPWVSFFTIFKNMMMKIEEHSTSNKFSFMFHEINWLFSPGGYHLYPGGLFLIQTREPNQTVGYMQIPRKRKPLKLQAGAVRISEYWNNVQLILCSLRQGMSTESQGHYVKSRNLKRGDTQHVAMTRMWETQRRCACRGWELWSLCQSLRLVLFRSCWWACVPCLHPGDAVSGGPQHSNLSAGSRYDTPAWLPVAPLDTAMPWLGPLALPKLTDLQESSGSSGRAEAGTHLRLYLQVHLYRPLLDPLPQRPVSLGVEL